MLYHLELIYFVHLIGNLLALRVAKFLYLSTVPWFSQYAYRQTTYVYRRIPKTRTFAGALHISVFAANNEIWE
jgi:hypothetical protein